MNDTIEITELISASLLDSASIRRVIKLDVAYAGSDLVVGAKVDLDAELTMREVSVVLHQAKRRVQNAVPDAKLLYIEPDVWVDPDAEQPTTSAIVTLSYD